MNIRKRSKDNKLNNILCRRLVELRKQKGISQEQLAYQSGISKGGLSEIERGLKEPTIKTILQLCFGLEITPKKFYDFIEIEKYVEDFEK